MAHQQRLHRLHRGVRASGDFAGAEAYPLVDIIIDGDAPPSWPEGACTPCLCCELLPGGTLLDLLRRTTAEEAAEPSFWRSTAKHALSVADGLSGRRPSIDAKRESQIVLR